MASLMKPANAAAQRPFAGRVVRANPLDQARARPEADALDREAEPERRRGAAGDARHDLIGDLDCHGQGNHATHAQIMPFYARAVSHDEHVTLPQGAQARVDPGASAVVDGQTHRARQGRRLHACRPHHQLGVEAPDGPGPGLDPGAAARRPR